MSKLKYVTDPEFIDKYIEAEARRKECFESNGWEFTPNVDPKELPLLSYETVSDVYGRTEQMWDKHDAFDAFVRRSAAHGGVRQDDLRCTARCFRQADDQLCH